MADGETIQMSLTGCTMVTLNEIERGLNQKQIASTYAMAIVSESRCVDAPDWRAINEAICKRWSPAGRERVKRMAWRILEKRHV